MGWKPMFDNGHAGLINGYYSTPGKRSPHWELGVLYEGMFNRWIVNLMMRECDLRGIPYYHLCPELEDVDLGERVFRADRIFKKDPNTYLLSIHSNAGGGTGFEGFTSKGETKSDFICTFFLEDLETHFKNFRMRKDFSDGDPDKEAGYQILKYSDSPAILLELLFMDHRNDYKFLWARKFQEELAGCMVDTIEKIYRREYQI